MILMKKHIEVVAAVIKKDNKYFCAQRDNFGELGGKWEFPGGKVEAGETLEESLKREIFEELKIDIIINEYLMTVNHEYETFKITLHTFLCEVNTNNFVLTEHINSRWVEKEDLEKLDFAEADKPIIEKIKES